jgi:RhoGAP domain/Fes/CIP4, and EFC/F-BAR homology domain
VGYTAHFLCVWFGRFLSASAGKKSGACHFVEEGGVARLPGTLGNMAVASTGTYTKFATDLWDGFDAICKRAKLEVQFMRDLHRYFQKRLNIEKEYSQALAGLSQKHEYSAPGGTLEVAFENVLSHTAHEASLHSSIAASFAEKIVDPVAVMVKDMDQVRQRLVAEGQAAIKEYQKSVSHLSEQQAKYVKLSREAVTARQALSNNKKDQNREKLERDVAKAEQVAHDADTDYRRAVSETNAAQDFFFNTKLPKVHSEFEHSMFVRIHMVKLKLKQFVTILEGVPPQDVQALSSLLKYVDALDNEADIGTFVVQHTSGDSPPLPFVYEGFDPDGDKKKKGKFARMGKTITKKKDKGHQRTGSQVNVPAGPGAALNVVGARRTTHTEVATSSVYQAFRPEDELGGKVFGRSMPDLMADQTDLPTAIPIFLQRVVEAIYALDGPSLEGIFRIPPVMEELNELKARIDREGPRTIDIAALSEDAYLPCGLLKAFLRELPEPLVPTEYYEICIHEPTRCIEVLNAIPELNRTVIVYLANFLQDLGSPEVIAKTLMPLENLSMVFAPSLLRCPYTDPMQILNAAKPEGFFALALLQQMPTRAQLAEGSSPSPEQQQAGQQQAADPQLQQPPQQAAYAPQAYAPLPGRQQQFDQQAYQAQQPPVVQQQQQQTGVVEGQYQDLGSFREPDEHEAQYRSLSAFVELPASDQAGRYGQ